MDKGPLVHLAEIQSLGYIWRAQSSTRASVYLYLEDYQNSRCLDSPLQPNSAVLPMALYSYFMHPLGNRTGAILAFQPY